MHYHMELIMPPLEDGAKLDDRLDEILGPWHEEYKYTCFCDDDDKQNFHGFYDYYVVGGRWSGDHLRTRMEQDHGERWSAFINEMENSDIMVSGVIAGKPTPVGDGVNRVQDVWQRHFPEFADIHNPLFNIPGVFPQKQIAGDVCTFHAIPISTTCSHFAVATPERKFSAERQEFIGDVQTYKLTFQLVTSLYNGSTWQNTSFDGTLQSALDHYNKILQRYRAAFRDLYTPKEDWLCVTIDYHN